MSESSSFSLRRRARRHRTVALLVGASIAAAVLAAAGMASAQMAASGSASFPPGLPGFELVRSNGAYDLYCTEGNSGTMSGTFTGTRIFTGCVKASNDGFTYAGTLTFRGTVAGCGTGTVVFRNTGSGMPTADGAPITRDHSVALIGKGTLPVTANLDAVGDASTGTLTYSGSYSC